MSKLANELVLGPGSDAVKVTDFKADLELEAAIAPTAIVASFR
jgi:hypothetical protein